MKEILIDKKVPWDDRWGRPVACDSNGTILWIPGVVRSSHGPVTRTTRRTVVLQVAADRKDSVATLLAEGEADIAAGRLMPARQVIRDLKRRLAWRPNPE